MTLETPLISIIVPIYNTKSYLKRCIDSLITQSLEQIEIILVDDGSTDESGLICDQFGEKDDRVRVFHRKNEGQSAARNYGISVARGEYVMFVDSDDWVMPEYCKKPFTLAKENNADIVLFRANVFSGEGVRIEQPVIPLKDGVISKEEAFLFLDKGIDNTPWNKLYRKNLFDTIQFPQGVFYEDIGTTYKTIMAADIICYASAELYNYYNSREGSASSQKNIKKVEDMFDMLFQKIHDMNDWGYDCKEYATRQALSYLVLIGRNSKYSRESEDTIKHTTSIPEDFSSKERFLFWTFRFSPILFDCLCRASGKRY